MPSTLRISLASILCGTLAQGAVTLDQPVKRATVWQPAVASVFDINLAGENLNASTVVADIIDIDLFDNTGNTINLAFVDTSVVDSFHKKGKKVICYFSGGSSETWRPDYQYFRAGDLGSSLDGWAGENWLNLRSNNVANIMRQRIAVAAKAGCDGIDPDNMDGYDNANGINLTQNDTINFFKNVLSPAAQQFGLGLGLKNAGAVLTRVLPYVQYSINEQCSEYSECADFTPFIKANKPVFHIEYPNGATNTPKTAAGVLLSWYCTKDPSGTDITKFSTVMKLMNLNRYTQFCNGRIISQ